MSPSEIIQNLAKYYNKEIKHAIIKRGITHIDGLVELLENFDRIGPINKSIEAERASLEGEQKRLDETIYNYRVNQPQGQQSWRAQPGGNSQDRMRRPQPLNTSSWQRNTQGSYGNRVERNPGQNTSGNIDRNNRPIENKSWRNNPEPSYQVKNMVLETEIPLENMEEEIIPRVESGNECSLVYKKR